MTLVWNQRDCVVGANLDLVIGLDRALDCGTYPDDYRDIALER